ncbi:MAG: hypothetical protein V3W34_00850 [Phycisphaerae bacterium]
MAVVVGIDEAGYGPLLGPLVVTGVAFQVPDEAAAECLWQRLQNSITKRIAKRDVRLPIVDSKKLFRRGDGLKALERSALVMLSAADHRPRRTVELMDQLAPHALGDLNDYPWYQDFDRGLPVANDAADIAVRANAVRRDMADGGVRLWGVFGEPLLEGHFNRRVGATRNKAVVSLGLVLRVVDRVVRAADGEPVRALIDRQGGRIRYRNSLMTAFGGCELHIDAESAERSAYRLLGGKGLLTIEFVTSGEEHHLPVALASIFSKYIRELFMMALNRFWCERVEGLNPTAGYYQDGQRFLGQIEAAVEREGVSRTLLVRSR